MKKMFYSATLILVISAVFLQGCFSSRIRFAGDLKPSKNPVPIYVYSVDSLFYSLENYELVGNELYGKGTVSTADSTHPFEGKIQLNRIEYAQFDELTISSALFSSLGVCLVGSMMLAHIHSGPEELTAQAQIYTYDPRYPGGYGGGGSCPFVYAVGADGAELQGEAIGTALGRAMETTGYTPLNLTGGRNGNIAIRVANERPETHYINQLQLKAYDIDEGCKIVFDSSGNAYQTGRTEAAAGASAEGADITAAVGTRDNRYWETTTFLPGGFEDRIELAFVRPKSAEEGLLVLNAINTKLSNVVFKQLFEFLGEQSLAYYRAVDNDTQMININKEWLKETALKVYVMKNGIPEYAGSVLPEANEISFSRAVRFDCGGTGDTVRIQLRALKDVWKLDDVGVSWGAVNLLAGRDVRMISAVDENGNDVKNKTSVADKSYKVLLPGGSIDAVFAPVKSPHGKKTVYASAVTGYLYEWPVVKNAEKVIPVAGTSSFNKVETVKLLLRHKEIFLPRVYGEWLRYKH